MMIMINQLSLHVAVGVKSSSPFADRLLAFAFALLSLLRCWVSGFSCTLFCFSFFFSRLLALDEDEDFRDFFFFFFFFEVEYVLTDPSFSLQRFTN